MSLCKLSNNTVKELRCVSNALFICDRNGQFWIEHSVSPRLFYFPHNDHIILISILHIYLPAIWLAFKQLLIFGEREWKHFFRLKCWQSQWAVSNLIYSLYLARWNHSSSLWENIKRYSYKGLVSIKQSFSGAWNGWLEHAWICLLFLEYILSTPFPYNLHFSKCHCFCVRY